MDIALSTWLICMLLAAAPLMGMLFLKRRGSASWQERSYDGARVRQLLCLFTLLLLSVLLTAFLFDGHKYAVLSLCALYAGVLFCVIYLKQILLILGTALRLLWYPFYVVGYALFHVSLKGVKPFVVPSLRRDPLFSNAGTDNKERAPGTADIFARFITGFAITLGAGMALFLAVLFLLQGIHSGLYDERIFLRDLTILSTLLGLISLTGAALLLLCYPLGSMRFQENRKEIRDLLERVRKR